MRGNDRHSHEGKTHPSQVKCNAPRVHIYTARHPLNIEERRVWEDCLPVTIDEECWIGGHVTICPGVNIGDRAVIGAGAVVTKDIPADTLAVENPARVEKKLNV